MGGGPVPDGCMDRFHRGPVENRSSRRSEWRCRGQTSWFKMEAQMFRIVNSLLPALLVLWCGTPAWSGEPLELTGGRIEVIDRARLACDQMGVLATEIPIEGTFVEQDQIVVELQDDIPRASLAAAEVLASSDADVRAKKNASELALVEWERAQRANRRTPGTVPELEVQRLELTYKQALLETEQAEKELELNQRRRDQASALLKSYRVKAPFSGTVTRVMHHRGEAVQQGDPILELVSIDRVRIALEVPLHQRLQLRTGMEVSVLPVGPEERGEEAGPQAEDGLPGRISFIDPAAEQLSRTVRVHVIVDDNDGHRLIPGLSAVVRIHP
jgi:multidrug efflux pump subunit AcrA (membrane-fusion protein)